MASSRYLLPAFFFFTLSSAAQSCLVHPRAYASREGESSTIWPYGSGKKWAFELRGVRFQQIQDRLSSRTVSIKGMSLRRDGRDAAPKTGWTVEMDLVLSTARHPAVRILPDFDANAGKDAVTVIRKKKIHFPALPPGWNIPKPFEIPLPFDKGKAFLLKGGASLCWETRVYWSDLSNRQEGSVSFDACYREEGILALPYGHGCYARYRTRPARMSLSAGGPGFSPWDLRTRVQYGPAFGWGILLVSPGQASVPIEAGGPFCRFYLDPRNAFPLSSFQGLGLQGSLRNTLLYFPVPRDPSLRGSALHFQWVLGDNNLQSLVFTNPVYMFIGYTWPNGPWLQTSSCVAYGKAPFLLGSGATKPYLGLVVEFRI